MALDKFPLNSVRSVPPDVANIAILSVVNVSYVTNYTNANFCYLLLFWKFQIILT
jgi:hypothetical protein